jgi:hypothetical protein
MFISPKVHSYAVELYKDCQVGDPIIDDGNPIGKIIAVFDKNNVRYARLLLDEDIFLHDLEVSIPLCHIWFDYYA